MCVCGMENYIPLTGGRGAAFSLLTTEANGDDDR